MTFLSILTINKKLRPIGSDIPLFESPFISYDLLSCKFPSFFKSAVNSDIVCSIELKDNEYIHQIKFGYPRNQGKHSHSRWHFAAKNTNRVCLRFKC